MIYKPVILINIEKTDNEKLYEAKTVHYIIEDSATISKPMPIKYFVVDEIDLFPLKLVLHKIENSIWWNVNGFFLIKNTVMYNTCNLASLIFDIIWKFNILNAVLLCRDHDLKIRAYIFNPYSSTAPAFWDPIENFKYTSDHSLTLFKNVYPITGNIKILIF